MALTTVITYDISQNRRRAQVAAVLQQWGQRVQRSVFVCMLDDDQALTEMIGRVYGIIDHDTDAVHIFRQCAECWNNVAALGQATTEEPELCWIIL